MSVIRFPPPRDWQEDADAIAHEQWEEHPLLKIDRLTLAGSLEEMDPRDYRGHETFGKAFVGALCVIIAGGGFAFAMLLL